MHRRTHISNYCDASLKITWCCSDIISHIQSKISYIEKNKTKFLYLEEEFTFIRIVEISRVLVKRPDTLSKVLREITWRDILSKTTHERHCVTRYLEQSVSRTTFHGEIFRLQMRKDQPFAIHWIIVAGIHVDFKNKIIKYLILIK